MNVRLTTMLSVGLLSVTPTLAGEILVGGWFYPGFSTGYVNGNTYNLAGDTSGMQFGNLIDFSGNALVPSLETLSFNSPVYGDQTTSFTIFDYISYTPAGLFYEERNASGDWLDVNIPYFGASPSFSFKDYASAPPPIDPPPCFDCVTPPPIPTPVPETSTWLMMLFGFIGLGYMGVAVAPQRKARWFAN